MSDHSTLTEAPRALDADTKEHLAKIAGTIRLLSMDAVQQANSGHPGMPMGCAEIGAYLYGVALKHNPSNPNWINRDRVILSAGHGSMWLYSCLHLSGYDLPLEEIKRFRQLHSITPGHPEATMTPGVETTTGPLGQGVGHAVGQALGLKILEQRFNREGFPIISAKVYCVAGDGCMIEAINHDVASLAGHLRLNNLILVYDANNVTLDGPLQECCSEDVAMRYHAYGWDVHEVDGHQVEELDSVIRELQKHQDRPTLIMAHTLIGKGSPNKAGSHKVHGSPLGEKEVEAAREMLGLPKEKFFIPQSVKNYFSEKLAEDAKREARWNTLFETWAETYPDLYKMFKKMDEGFLPSDLEEMMWNLEIPSPIAGRMASHHIVNFLADHLPQLVGGSADLSCSDMTMLNRFPLIAPGEFHGRNIKYGEREFGMAAMAAGISQTGMLLPFVGTFLTFSDYMRNAIRLICLMRRQVIFQFTHDSIFLGEDGPTHQPVEHYSALRAMPFLHVIRPADANEVKMAWISALHYDGPTAIILSRQGLPTLEQTARPFQEGVGRGAYLIKRERVRPDYTLFATGSEVSLALDVSAELEKRGKDVRVVSMPCWEIFEAQDAEYKQSIVGGDLGRRVSIEAGVDLGWHKYIGREGVAICMESFGESAPAGELAIEFGFTVESILDRIL